MASWVTPPPEAKGIYYQIIDTMTRQIYSDVKARTVWPTRLQAIAAYNDSRRVNTPAFAAQSRYALRAAKMQSVK